jgi:hypothetical protein
MLGRWILNICTCKALFLRIRRRFDYQYEPSSYFCVILASIESHSTSTSIEVALT